MRAIAVAVMTVMAPATIASQSARSPRDTAWMLLDAFLAGRDQQVTSDLRAARDLRVVAREFPQFAETWIDRAPADEREHRFRVSAVVQLELIRETLGRPPAVYENGRHGIESYCSRFRERPPSQFEHTWMLASVALFQGAHDDRLLSGVGPGYQIFTTESHSHHASSRFPSEMRFELAAIPWGDIGVVSRRPDDRLPDRLVFGPKGLVSVPLTEVLSRFATRLAGIPETSPVYAEAQLRLGIVRYQLKDFSKSLEALERAARAADPFVGYLAHLFAGRVQETLDRRPDAIAAYRAAVQVNPQAHSGAVSLASLLFLDGNRNEATAVMNATTPESSDPWRIYGSGDLRFWPAYRTSLLALLNEMRSRQ